MGTQPYFAYGSNMNNEQMKHRCPTAVPNGVAKLLKHRFLINTRGVASVEPVLIELLRYVMKPHSQFASYFNDRVRPR